MIDESNNKKRTSLGSKLSVLVIILVFCSAALSIIAGYMEHTRTTDEFYEQLAQNIAETVSNSLNGTKVKTLLEAAKDSSYQKILKDARERQDNTEIVKYLDQKNLLYTYDNINEILVQYSRYMEIKYIYLQSMEDGVFCRIIDPDEGYISYGLTEELDGPYAKYSNQNVTIPPTISSTSDGVLCTCFEPVYDSEGTPVAVVGVDISMEYLRGKHRRFAVISFISALIMASLAALCGVIFMRRHVTDPLEKLAEQTRQFTDKKGVYTKEDIIVPDIQSRDEIEDLYYEIQSMEKKIVTYLDHLVKVTGEKERVRTELGIAAQIQKGMLPNDFDKFSTRNEFDLYAAMQPAREVGGDFYDFYLIDDDHLVLTIADVSGKGVPASMFMAITKSLLKISSSPVLSPSGLITGINDQICRENSSGMFISVWIGILELSTGILTACNAGHEYPVISRAGEPFEILKDKHSLVMGAMAGVKYTDYQLTLQPGDRIFVYTDGVVESADADNKFFGMDRMVECLSSEPNATPRQLIKGMFDSISEFVKSAPQFDDITMLSLVYNPEPSESSTRIEETIDSQ